MNRLDGFQFVHILCFYMHEYDPELKLATRIPKEIKGLGNYAIRIKDMQTFVDLLFDKIVRDRLYGLMGPVSYRNPTDEIEYMDCFDKNITHQFEHEWRFALIPDFEKAKEIAEEQRQYNSNLKPGELPKVYDKAMSFDVGDLRDLAEVMDAEQLVTDTGKMYGSDYKTVENLPYKWESRKKLLEEIHENYGLPVTYQAYPEQYVGWSPRKAFRDKVMEIDSGIKPLIIFG